MYNEVIQEYQKHKSYRIDIYYILDIMKSQWYNRDRIKKEVSVMSAVLETVMLICFGLSWPVNVWKNLKAGTAKNMSLPFILLIIFGYVAGISAKLLVNQTNYVLVVYFINLVVVTLNLMVYFRNKRLDAGKICEIVQTELL